MSEPEAKPEDLYDPDAWDRWATQMQRATDYHEEQGRADKAAYHRRFVARFREAAARLRRVAA